MSIERPEKTGKPRTGKPRTGKPETGKPRVRAAIRVAGALLASHFCLMPAMAGAEWQVRGPVTELPTWLDGAAFDQARQAEAAETALERAERARQRWLIREQERRAGLARVAETVSSDGRAKLAFGCGSEGGLYMSLLVSGYRVENGMVRVTHWVDDGLPGRVPWYSVPGDLEMRVFTDRAFFVEQFLQDASEGARFAVQVETFPAVVFPAPDRARVIAPIMENCMELASDMRMPAHLAENAELTAQQ